MKAWQVTQLGEPSDVLALVDIDPPTPGPGAVLVRVDAVGLNFPDILLCQGKYQERPELPFTPGLEVAGTILEIGEGATAAVGDRVYGSPGLPNGGCAELAVLGPGGYFATPAGMDDVTASSWFITYQTAHVALHRRAAIEPGETLLVHAGAGGVGSAAIQVGKAAGATVIATAGGPAKVEVCEKLGADAVIDYSSEDIATRVKELTHGAGADVIFDPVGGSVFEASTKCVAFEGRILVIGFAGGEMASAATNHALVKNYSIDGVHWGLYRLRAPEVIGRTADALATLFASGEVAPLISEVCGMDELPAALTRLGARGTVGKVVLTPGG